MAHRITPVPKYRELCHLYGISDTYTHLSTDILMPDIFFRYWTVKESDIPHLWYKPPFNWVQQSSFVPWQDRIPKVYWRVPEPQTIAPGPESMKPKL